MNQSDPDHHDLSEEQHAEVQIGRNPHKSAAQDRPSQRAASISTPFQAKVDYVPKDVGDFAQVPQEEWNQRLELFFNSFRNPKIRHGREKAMQAFFGESLDAQALNQFASADSEEILARGLEFSDWMSDQRLNTTTYVLWLSTIRLFCTFLSRQEFWSGQGLWR